MKIGIDINPILDKAVGKGSFLKNILQSLSSIDSKNEYFLYGKENPYLDLHDNFKFIKIGGEVGLKWDFHCYLLASYKQRVNVFYTAKSFYSAILQRKSVLSVHDIGPLILPEAYPTSTVRRYKRLLKLSLLRARRIVTPSSVVKSYIVSKFGAHASKVVKISEGVPRWTKHNVSSDDTDRVNATYHLLQKFFLFAGTLEPRKNLLALIDAFKEFRKVNTEDYKIVVIGKRGYKHEEIFNSIIDNELAHDILFLGHIPEIDLKPIYIQAKAFIFPSLHEGFGISPLEAMACEIPVICSRKGAIGETVDDACLEINPRDVSSITSAMLQIVKGGDLAKKLIAKGVKRTKLFSWDKSAKKLLSVFNEVAGKS